MGVRSAGTPARDELAGDPGEGGRVRVQRSPVPGEVGGVLGRPSADRGQRALDDLRGRADVRAVHADPRRRRTGPSRPRGGGRRWRPGRGPRPRQRGPAPPARPGAHALHRDPQRPPHDGGVHEADPQAGERTGPTTDPDGRQVAGRDPCQLEGLGDQRGELLAVRGWAEEACTAQDHVRGGVDHGSADRLRGGVQGEDEHGSQPTSVRGSGPPTADPPRAPARSARRPRGPRDRPASPTSRRISTSSRSAASPSTLPAPHSTTVTARSRSASRSRSSTSTEPWSR